MINTAKFIGSFIEERDGKKVIVEKYETIKAIAEHNSKIEEQKIKLESEKVSESIEVGAVVKEPLDLLAKIHADIQALEVK